MSFRKKNVGLSRDTQVVKSSQNATLENPKESSNSLPGTRPSPIDGRLTTSTGAPSLDGLLAGHSGLPLGCSLVLEESGTTDYAGSLLRYFAAEGIVQGHHIHLLGLGDRWVRNLPGVVGTAEENADQPRDSRSGNNNSERMKIAWRYESLGQIEDESLPRRIANTARASPAALSRAAAEPPAENPTQEVQSFCHTFDLAKRLDIPAAAKISSYLIDTTDAQDLLKNVMYQLEESLRSTAVRQVHRFIVPSFLSPALYPLSISQPQVILPFLHSLRALHRQHPDSLVSMMTLPISLYTRQQSIIRWTETLAESVIELTPFPHRLDDYSVSGHSPKPGNANTPDELPQGMVKVHKLPVYHERGGGSGVQDLGGDLAFTMSRRRFVIKPYSLPPADGDTEAQKEAGTLTKDQIDF